MQGFFDDLVWRGLIHQVTHEELKARLNTPGMTLYCGFDPTADSLHIGSLLPLINLRRFQQAGHRVIALLGGGTGMIGDPSGKSEERRLLTEEVLSGNIRGIRAQIERFIDLEPSHGLVLNNLDWLGSCSLIDFLRDIGKHFSVNMMMDKDSVRSRLEDRAQGISYTEFSYMLLQSYDFLHLNRNFGCQLQIGGSDQWGNITAGMELIRRLHGGEAYGLTWPLLTKSDGSKFGKSEKGNIWLDARYSSAYTFYQFLLRSEDKDVSKLLRYFTFLDREEILALESTVQERPEAREAQRRLAQEVTTLVHGADEARRAESASQALFGGSLEALDARTLLEVFAEAPSTTRARSEFEGEGLSLVEILVATGLCPSKGQARKDIASGGVYVNNQRASERNLTSGDLLQGQYLLLRKGKKTYHLVQAAT